MNRPLILAHRGASAYAPENTLSAFKKAFELGSDGIELDIHLTSDGEIVCIHDYTVDRTSNGRGAVGEMTLSELKELDFGEWFSKTYKHEKIPTLEEALDLVASANLLLNIEIKGNYDGIEEKTVRLVENKNMQKRVIISSFDHNILKKIKKLAPNFDIGLLISPGKMVSLDYAMRLGARAIHPWYQDIDENSIKLFLESSIDVNVYTVDRPQDIKAMASLGVTSIITNVPDKAKNALDRKNFIR